MRRQEPPFPSSSAGSCARKSLSASLNLACLCEILCEISFETSVRTVQTHSSTYQYVFKSNPTLSVYRRSRHDQPSPTSLAAEGLFPRGSSSWFVRPKTGCPSYLWLDRLLNAQRWIVDKRHVIGILIPLPESQVRALKATERKQSKPIGIS